VPYPSPAEEMEIVRRVGTSMPTADQAIDLDELERLQGVCDQIYVDRAITQYAVDLVMATREPALRGLPELEPLLEFGVSPRATLGLVAAGRALALLRGRSYVVPQDVFDMARDVLRHRLMLSYESLAKGLSDDDILNRLLAVVHASTISPRESTNGRAAMSNGLPNTAAPDYTLPAGTDVTSGSTDITDQLAVDQALNLPPVPAPLPPTPGITPPPPER
jgi:MoxR-like ATPase